MKRITSLILAVCLMCCVLSACESQTPYQLVSAALEKTNTLNDMDAVMEMSITAEANGQSLTIPMTLTVKASQMQSDNPKMLMGLSMKMDIAGFSTDISMDIYFADGWAYVGTGGSGYKVNASDMQDRLGSNISTDMVMQTLPEELLNKSEIKKNPDGSQTVSASIDGETFSTLYKELIDTMNSATDTDVSGLTVSDAVVTVTVKDGYISVYDMDFTMNIDVSGTTVKSTATASVTYNDPGKAVTVTPPAGYLDFSEIG